MKPKKTWERKGLPCSQRARDAWASAFIRRLACRYTLSSAFSCATHVETTYEWSKGGVQLFATVRHNVDGTGTFRLSAYDGGTAMMRAKGRYANGPRDTKVTQYKKGRWDA